jgi:hypothetical protein
MVTHLHKLSIASAIQPQFNPSILPACALLTHRDSYRILIVDGHGSYFTRKFLQYCLTYKIILCILPPHSTYSLQPLDVKKADFFMLFRDAYNTSFTRENILKSFEATGVKPRDASVVLQRFTTPPPQLDNSTKLGEHGDGDTWGYSQVI